MTQFVLALVLGTLFAIGTFLMLRRDVVRVVWGVTIVSQTANVYLITMGGLGGGAPILGHGHAPDPATVTDPLVQALVLTAIVIGFGTTALALVLTYRVYQEHGTIDLHTVAEEGAVSSSEPVADGGTTPVRDGATVGVADDDGPVDDTGTGEAATGGERE
jgi:multicomponent Na+:H+ antiporter subunit C